MTLPETQEAQLESRKNGLRPTTEGWFVLNTAEAEWKSNPQFGQTAMLRGDQQRPDYGVNIQRIEPGQSSCFYHAEDNQEDFFVLEGECVLIVAEQERRIKKGDYFHCPAGTRHVFVADQAPCLLLMIGSNRGNKVFYPRSKVAEKWKAQSPIETDSPKEAYAKCPDWQPAQFDAQT